MAFISAKDRYRIKNLMRFFFLLPYYHGKWEKYIQVQLTMCSEGEVFLRCEPSWIYLVTINFCIWSRGLAQQDENYAAAVRYPHLCKVENSLANKVHSTWSLPFLYAPPMAKLRRRPFTSLIKPYHSDQEHLENSHQNFRFSPL